MTFLTIHYDRVSQTLTAQIEQGLTVAYNTDDNTLVVEKDGVPIVTSQVSENYPARAFIEYCFAVSLEYSDTRIHYVK